MKKSHLSLAITLTLMFLVWQGTALAFDPTSGILSISKGVVTGKETATGATFDFFVADAAFLKRLKAGDAISVNFRTNTATVKGRQFAITNLNEPQTKLPAGRYAVTFDRENDWFVVKNVQTGQIVRHRANVKWTKAWANLAARLNGRGAVLGQTQGGAEASYQSICDQQASSSGLSHCTARCTLTTTGSDPTDIDDEYSCTCICG